MSAINSFSTSAPPSTGNAFQALSSEDFIRIIFTELTNQDPSQPSDSKDLLQQISTIRAIESDIGLTNRLEQISLQNEIAASSSLLGSFVRGLSDTGLSVLGFVDSVSVTREGTVLNLSSKHRVPLKSVQEVIDPALISTTPPAETPTDETDESDEG